MDLVHDRASIVAEEDRISNLSDKIIHHILSFVDMKNAIRTSKISRRWRHIWTTMPHLNLDTSEFRYLPQFANFMRHALSHRNNSASVSSVNLKLTGAPTSFAVKSMINYAFSHNVKQLTMRCDASKSFEFPQCLFCSHTLKILTLTVSETWDDRYHATCFVPESGWDFPSLETLNLSNIEFTGDTDKSLNPFSKCVNLKNLTLDKFCMSHVGIFIIYAPQLSNLTITKAFGVINVVAPQLQNLTASLTYERMYSKESKLQLLTEGFNSLEKVELSLFSSRYQENDVPFLLDMFHKFSSATVLILDKHIIEVISSCLDKFSHEPCPFNNLKCLKVHGVSCYPTRAKNYLLENSLSATFIMDSPQVPQKRSREPVPNDGMVNKVAKLEAENKQAETTDKENRTLKVKIPTQGEVIAKLRAKIQIPETTKWQYEKLMPRIIKGKVAELNLQVESGNPDYEVIRSMGCEIKSLIDLIPKCSWVAMQAHFSTWYKEMKQRSRTYIQIWSDILTTDTVPTPSLANTTKRQYEKLMPHIIKGKMSELKLQVESGNPDYEVISSMVCEIKSLIDLIPECSRVAWEAHFSSMYKEVKRLSWTYIKSRQWAKIETQLGYLKDSERVYSNNIQIRSDVLTTDAAPMHSSVNDGDTFVDETRYKQVDGSKQKQTNLMFNKDTSGECGSSVNVWRHDELAIKEALLDFFVCAEVPFKLVEHWAFVRLVNKLNGKVKLPSRHKLSKDIAKYYIEERSKLFVYLSDPKTTIHLTTDTWTSSCQKVNYMVVTAHFIDENWVMHKRIINFRPIESHKRDDTGFELLRCINGWGIQNVMTITLGNASSNDKAIEYLLKKLPNLYGKGKHFHVRCMTHILNLIVKDGLCNQMYHVERVQKAIRYIRHSTERITKFKECMKKEKLESQKFLCLDCPTRWNSTYEMLKIVVGLQKVFSKYESADPCYERDLVRIPDRDDFNASEKMVQFLEKFKDKTETVSATSKPLSHLFLREVLDVDNHLRVWETDVDFCHMVRQMRENFDKYWGRFDKLNDYFYFAVILDPTMKSVFVRHCFRAVITNAVTEENPMSKTFIEKMVGVLVGDVENRLGKLFETYQARFDTASSGYQEARNKEYAIKSQGKNDFFANFLHVEGHTSVAMETELIRYLHEPEVNFEPGFDILKWWSLNGNRFPIVAHMARDILAIQISSVASESAFSTVGRVLDPYRSRLPTNIVEALICTQDWVKKSSNSIYMDQVDDILNDDNIAIEIEEAINRKDKGKEQMLVEE